MNKIMETPVFLVGCMRSGTTLSANLLGKHPKIIYCPFELRTIWSKVGNVPMASPKTRDRVCPCLKETDVKPGQAERLSAAFLQEISRKRRKRNLRNSLFLNKNPHLSNKLPFVNALFPNARFIWIYRDMPSVVSGLKKIFDRKEVHYWPEKKNRNTERCWRCFFDGIPAHIDRKRCFPGGDVRYLAEYWYETNKALSMFFKSIPSDRSFVIKEEELIKHPEKVLTACQAFLDLPIKLPKKLINQIDRNRNDLWSKRLTNPELNSLFDYICECGHSLDEIFPEEKHLFKRYKELIRTQLKTENEPQSKQ